MPLEVNNQDLSFEALKKRLTKIILEGDQDEAYYNGLKFLKDFEKNIMKLTKKQQRKLNRMVEF